MYQNEESEFLFHTSCPSCGSSDGNAVYSNETTYCWVCRKWGRLDGSTQKPSKRRRMAGLIDAGEIKALGARKISEETCRKYGYSVGEHKGVTVQIAPYYRDRELVAQKLRTADKKFSMVGNAQDIELFGQHLWPNDGGRRVIVTEGEIDCLTIAQAFNLKWAVVSVPNGAQGAKKALQRNLEFLERYAEIVLAFDDDKAGRAAVEECAQLFTPGKVKVMQYGGHKDANAAAQAGLAGEIPGWVFSAVAYQPDGIVTGEDLWEEIQKPVEWGLSYPWEELTKATYGIRLNELVALGAGTGMGKTDLFKEIITHLLMFHQQKVGLVFLEESNRDTALGIMSKHASKLFHIPDADYTPEDKQKAYEETMKNGRVFMYNHFGHTDYETIKSKIRYMAVSCGCRYIFLDHVTALVSGDKDGDERKQLDYIMTDLASLVRELHINIHFISHLATPEGKPHEEGGRVMIKHFRGSRAIGQWSSFMFGLERNQQEEDVNERHTSLLRILKDRYTGRATGFTMRLRYNQDTGRLSVAPPKEEKDECPFEDEFAEDKPF